MTDWEPLEVPADGLCGFSSLLYFLQGWGFLDHTDDALSLASLIKDETVRLLLKDDTPPWLK